MNVFILRQGDPEYGTDIIAVLSSSDDVMAFLLKNNMDALEPTIYESETMVSIEEWVVPSNEALTIWDAATYAKTQRLET